MQQCGYMVITIYILCGIITVSERKFQSIVRRIIQSALLHRESSYGIKRLCNIKGASSRLRLRRLDAPLVILRVYIITIKSKLPFYNSVSMLAVSAANMT